MIDLDFLNAEHARALDRLAAEAPLRPCKVLRQLSWRRGGFHLHGTGFLAPWHNQLGQTVEVHYDPDNLAAGVDVFTASGRFLGRSYRTGRNRAQLQGAV